MKFICDGSDGCTWFRLDSAAEASAESAAMEHAVEKFFRNEWAKALASFKPATDRYIEQEIGLKAHLERNMPLFLTLRDAEGEPLATAMLPPAGRAGIDFKAIIVGRKNTDPYPAHGDAIGSLEQHFGLVLDRMHCYPYRR